MFQRSKFHAANISHLITSILIVAISIGLSDFCHQNSNFPTVQGGNSLTRVVFDDEQKSNTFQDSKPISSIVSQFENRALDSLPTGLPNQFAVCFFHGKKIRNQFLVQKQISLTHLNQTIEKTSADRVARLRLIKNHLDLAHQRFRLGQLQLAWESINNSVTLFDSNIARKTDPSQRDYWLYRKQLKIQSEILNHSLRFSDTLELLGPLQLANEIDRASDSNSLSIVCDLICQKSIAMDYQDLPGKALIKNLVKAREKLKEIVVQEEDSVLKSNADRLKTQLVFWSNRMTVGKGDQDDSLWKESSSVFGSDVLINDQSFEDACWNHLAIGILEYGQDAEQSAISNLRKARDGFKKSNDFNRDSHLIRDAMVRSCVYLDATFELNRMVEERVDNQSLLLDTIQNGQAWVRLSPSSTRLASIILARFSVWVTDTQENRGRIYKTVEIDNQIKVALDLAKHGFDKFGSLQNYVSVATMAVQSFVNLGKTRTSLATLDDTVDRIKSFVKNNAGIELTPGSLAAVFRPAVFHLARECRFGEAFELLIESEELLWNLLPHEKKIKKVLVVDQSIQTCLQGIRGLNEALEGSTVKLDSETIVEIRTAWIKKTLSYLKALSQSDPKRAYWHTEQPLLSKLLAGPALEKFKKSVKP